MCDQNTLIEQSHRFWYACILLCVCVTVCDIMPCHVMVCVSIEVTYGVRQPSNSIFSQVLKV